MRSALLILSCVSSLATSSEIECPKHFGCETSETPDSCPEGFFYRENGRLHGCCPGCLPQQGEGEGCDRAIDCRPGLTCVPESKKCERDPSQACEYFKLTDPIWSKTRYWNATCLPDGTFAPKQCKGEKMYGKCFCADKTGKRIFGEEDWSEAENMTCACSRIVHETKEKGSEVSLRCDRIGNFEPLQCDGKVCWCGDAKTGIPYAGPVSQEAMDALPCYDEKKVGASYHRRCDSAKRAQKSAKTLLSNHGTEKVSLEEFECNFDGSHARVRTRKEKKRCVYADDSPLTEAVESAKADCNCAYDRRVSELERVPFDFDCEPDGNYRSPQNWNGIAYCVDGDGFAYSCVEGDREESAKG